MWSWSLGWDVEHGLLPLLLLNGGLERGVVILVVVNCVLGLALLPSLDFLSGLLVESSDIPAVVQEFLLVSY